MVKGIGHITILVHNQSDAIEFYTKKFGFDIVESHKDEDGNWYWVTIAPKGSYATVFTLMAPTTDEERDLVGRQTGSIPLAVLLTDDCRKTAQELKNNGVTFIKEPTEEFWGVDALFTDLYGNIFDLCQPADEETVSELADKHIKAKYEAIENDENNL